MERFLKDVTKKAGKKVLKLFGKVGVQYTKEHAMDVVTKADLISHDYIVSQIRKKYPTHRIISEEGEDGNKDSENVWIVDPLDGTLNFLRSTPMFGVLVCFVKKNVLELAAIYLPYFDDFYFARRGKGAYHNGHRIHASQQKTLKSSLGCSSGTIRLDREPMFNRFIKAKKHSLFAVNALGCCAVMSSYVADGRRDWVMSKVAGAWDIAAPVLLMREAGCKVTNFKREEWKLGDLEVLGANPRLHKELLKIFGE